MAMYSRSSSAASYRANLLYLLRLMGIYYASKPIPLVFPFSLACKVSHWPARYLIPAEMVAGTVVLHVRTHEFFKLADKADFPSRAGSGWRQHCKRHQCNPRCFDDDNNPDREARRKPTDREFIKYTGLLLQGLRGGLDSRHGIIEQYRNSWVKVYPDQPIRLDANGDPENFSQLAELPTVWPVSPSASGVVTASTSSSTAPSQAAHHHPVTPAPVNPPPSAAQDLPPLSSSAASPWDHPSPSTLNAPVTASPLNPPPSHSPPSAPPPTNDLGATSFADADAEMLLHLTQHTFPIKTLPMFSQIVGGLVPGFKMGARPKPRLALFPQLSVLSLRTRFPGVDRGNFAILSGYSDSPTSNTPIYQFSPSNLKGMGGNCK
ncbi:hypothetical protein BDZ97DRAFT_1761876 [Flammula alnicola]|nr:hypothetical protein BDZ97DRAFT_1761876 [Flammula alnicola]